MTKKVIGFKQGVYDLMNVLFEWTQKYDESSHGLYSLVRNHSAWQRETVEDLKRQVELVGIQVSAMEDDIAAMRESLDIIAARLDKTAEERLAESVGLS
jgi:hypothetical protein